MLYTYTDWVRNKWAVCGRLGSIQILSVLKMSDEHTLYIPEESLLGRFKTDEPVCNNRRIYSVSKAIEREENDSVSITFEITNNGTVRCSFRGTLSRINRARSLLEYRLTGGQQTDAEPIDGVTPLTLENLTRFNASLTETRQYGCRQCKHVWWRKTFTYKPVSHCPKCNTCYNPIPIDQMFGWGKFVCQCGNVFFGRAQAASFSPCFSCGEMVRPSVVGPMPTSRPQNRTGRQHACEACHSGTIRPCPSYSIMTSYSTRHDCTGSTVSTFLTQATTVPSEFGSEL